ncbi:hypothetical protein BpHYR1_021532 [Brachionus plicatilis]|uniref:Uncharacterized protein n=1 Tax=Brachionus plicatilis TaxID=10195 RepID=A0A3M7SF78_BRAPC|nr:hypothetical protein BpHYR1_021532 [Brachionus plicatilis]
MFFLIEGRQVEPLMILIFKDLESDTKGQKEYKDYYLMMINTQLDLELLLKLKPKQIDFDLKH